MYTLSSFQLSDQPNEIQVMSPQMPWNLDSGPEETLRLTVGYLVVNSLLSQVVDMPDQQPSSSQPVLYGLALWELKQWGGIPKWLERQNTDAIRMELQNGRFSPLVHSPSFVDTTIAEYVAESYGRHRLADILKVATRYDDLHDLIPAALDVDIESFEAGWRAYLEQTYGDSNQ